MDQPFEHANIKLERGNRHSQELSATFEEWVNQLMTVITKSDGPDGRDVLRLNNAAPLNFYAAIIGDAVHNYRSALDMIAIECVRLAGDCTKGVHFPFAASEIELDRQIADKKFNRAGQRCEDLLRTFKPFKTKEWNPLRTLHDLDVADKHRALIPTVSVMHLARIFQESFDEPPTTISVMAPGGSAYIDGNKVGKDDWFFIPAWKPPIFRGKLELTFDHEGILAGRPVVLVLAEFSRIVARIIREFYILLIGPVV